jgi:uracil-DNA glycosylase
MNIKNYLNDIAAQSGLPAGSLQFPDCDIDPAKIKVIMISEVPHADPNEGFYGKAENPDYMKTTLGLFAAAGVEVSSIQDILDLGIYITTAAKSTKSGYAVDSDALKAQLPILEAELALFPNLKVIMLMGDVAKKAVNMIVKAKTKKNIIPADSTYKIRNNEYFWGSIRVFPSYIMTGKNLLIEKGKCDTIADDIHRMMEEVGYD